MYVHIFTSLRTNQFNQVSWLQASLDLTVDLAAVRKLGVDCFSKYLKIIVEKKRGDAEEEK